MVIRQRRGCDLNPGPSASESSTLTTRLPSHPLLLLFATKLLYLAAAWCPVELCSGRRGGSASATMLSAWLYLWMYPCVCVDVCLSASGTAVLGARVASFKAATDRVKAADTVSR